MAETRTPEQIEADDALELAIQRVAHAYDMQGTGPDHMFGEFLIMTYWPSLTEDEGTYHWFVNGRALPRHHVIGLHKMQSMMLKLEFEGPEE